MGRQKGDGRGRLGGRTKDTPNKITAAGRSVAEAIVEENYDKAKAMLDRIIDPKDWTMCYLKYMEYAVPKKAAVSITDETKSTDIHSELMEMAKRERERRKKQE